MKVCISQAVTLTTPFADDLTAYADAGCGALEIWCTKLEQHLQHHSLAETRQLLSDRGLTVAAASYQGGLLLSQGEQRAAHYEHFRRRLDLCEGLGIPTLLIVPDFAEKANATTLELAVESLARAAQWAAGAGVTLALEFRSHERFCATLPTAAALVAQCGEPNVGVNFDVFHYYTGASKFEDLSVLTAQNLAFVQLCDLAGTPRELATDADRVLPGDGDFQLAPIIEHFRRIGYKGWVSVEVLNHMLWTLKASQVVELAYNSLQRLMGESPRSTKE